MSLTAASCGTGTENSNDSGGRNAAVVAGTVCKKAGRYATVSRQKVVCGSGIAGRLWYSVASVKKTKCTKAGAIRKNRGVAFVCGATSKGKFWIATKTMPAATVTVAPGTGNQTVALLEQTDRAASVTDAPVPEDIVTIMPVRGADDPASGVTTTTQAPRLLPPLAELRFSDIAVGTASACGVLTDGSVRCWGYNVIGQLGDGTDVSSSLPVPNLVFDGIRHKARNIETMSGASYCAVDINDAVWCWGANDYGQLGNGTLRATSQPTMVPDLDGVRLRVMHLVGGPNQFCAVTFDLDPYCWGGGGREGLFGVQAKPLDQYARPTRIGGLAPASTTRIAVSTTAACNIDRLGAVQCWGTNLDGILGPNLPQNGTNVGPQKIVGTGSASGQFPAAEIVASDSTMCIRNLAGEVRCWGHGRSTGTDSATTVFQPKTVVGFDGVTRKGGSIYASAGGTCSRDRVSGAFYCWGWWERKSDGTLLFDVVPRALPYAASSRKISLSYSNHGVLDMSGSVSMYGLNNFGQMGDGTATRVIAD